MKEQEATLALDVTNTANLVFVNCWITTNMLNISIYPHLSSCSNVIIHSSAWNQKTPVNPKLMFRWKKDVRNANILENPLKGQTGFASDLFTPRYNFTVSPIHSHGALTSPDRNCLKMPEQCIINIHLRQTMPCTFISSIMCVYTVLFICVF